MEAGLLNKVHYEAERKADEAEKYLEELEVNRVFADEKGLDEQYDIVCGWSEGYDCCDTETKKMMLTRVFKEIKVRRGYGVEIDLTDAGRLLGSIFEKLSTKTE